MQLIFRQFLPAWILMMGLLFPSAVSPQVKSPADTTVKLPRSQETSELDTIIDYSARRIESTLDSKVTYLIGQAEVRYRNMVLRAGKITIDWNRDLLIAEGLPDTVVAVSGNPGDSVFQVVYRELPQFSEGGETMTGFRMFYNFRTQKGRVIRGRTQYEGGYYFGEKIKKVTAKTLFVSNGYFTTCELEENPHFHFQSRRMKLIVQDKVIAKPVILYIKHIPILGLPFAIFPHRGGRHSGLLIPRYGESVTEGRYIRGLGYYWAPSEYWDLKAQMDYFEKTGFLFQGDFNYAIRYVLRGRISGSLLRKRGATGGKQRRWDLRIHHRQQISPTLTFTASGTFLSDASFYQEFSANRNERLRRELRSNATLTKVWRKSGTSLTINLSEYRNLDTETITQTLPQIQFRKGRTSIFGGPSRRERTARRRSGTSKQSLRWYQSIYYSYSANALNRITRGKGLRGAQGMGVEHRVTVNSPQKIFHWITLNLQGSYNEVWVDRYREFFWDDSSQSIRYREVKKWAFRRTFQTGLSLGTKLYGLFPVGIAGIKAFRHVVTPSLSFSYQPDFSEERFPYYQVVQDLRTGKIVKRDRFEGGLFGPTPRGGRNILTFSVQNLFQMKTGEGESEKKFNLFNLNFSSGYNFKADSLKISPLQTSFRASPSRKLSITLNATHSFYRWDPQLRRVVNVYLFREKPWAPLRLVRLSLASSLRLNSQMFRWGRKKEKAAEGESAAPEESLEEDFSPPDLGGFGYDRFDMGEGLRVSRMSWDLNLRLIYSLNKYNPLAPQKTYRLEANLNLKLTRNWQIRYGVHLDLKDKKIISQDVVIYRDLHCWEARFVWNPSGPYRFYYLKINVKSSILRDLKFEKRGGQRPALFGY